MSVNKENPMIPDKMLKEMAAPHYAASIGEWDDNTRAMLAMALPEIAAELLQRRAAFCLAIHPEAARQSLDRARTIIRAPEPISRHALMAACQTLLMHSREAAELSAAREIIDQLEAAA